MEEVVFGTDGWRAVIADQFTFANVEKVVGAVGLYILNHYGEELPVLIGYDTRFLADKFARRAAEVLSSMGLAVKIVTRDVPTPCIAYAAKHEPTAGTLQFTASHNPPEYLGIKYIPHYAGPATDDITKEIAANLKKPITVSSKKGKITEFDPKPPYLMALAKLVDLKRIGAAGLKVGVDPLYGTSRDYLDAILREAGVHVEVIHNWRDTNFGGGMPEPKKQCLGDLMALVKSKKLDAGLATDGDADRLGVIDNLGNYLLPNQVLPMLARHLIKNRNMRGALVRTVATTYLMDCLAKKYDLPLVETPVGFKYIGEVMRQQDVLIGGEESGGVSILGHIPEKDGIMANLLLLEMLAYEKKPLTQIWQDLVAEAGVTMVDRRVDYHLPDGKQKELKERLKAKPPTMLAGQKVVKTTLKDGIKLYLNENGDTWIVIRPSGTEPLVRLYAESPSEALADGMLTDCKLQVEALLKELENESTVRDRQPISAA